MDSIKISDLCEITGSTDRIKVKSARNGRILIANAKKKESKEAYGELHVWGLSAEFDLSHDRRFALPIMCCWCREDEYKRAKEAFGD